MKACPLVLSHPSEAQQLTGIGPKLCDRLTEKLKEFCEENGLPMPVRKSGMFLSHCDASSISQI
jgi:hypothetical protein